MDKLVTKLFKQLVEAGLFIEDLVQVVMISGMEVEIQGTPEQGIALYEDYMEGEKVLMLWWNDDRAQWFTHVYNLNDLPDILEGLLKEVETSWPTSITTIVETPGLCVDRFRKICQSTSSRKIGMTPSGKGFSLPGGTHTLDQWFATKGK